MSPLLCLTAPVANASYTLPATVALSATADGIELNTPISKVEYYQGTTLIGSDTTSPYSVNWTPTVAGPYSLTAKATDSGGATTTSAAVSLTVKTAVTAIYYIQGDHLGTPRIVTDSAKKVVWRNHPLGEPFGLSPVEEDPDADGQKFVLNLRFAGQYYDKETGTHYNMQRDYDPAAGRYLQSDPIGLAGGANTYAYVGSNPLQFVDPWGLCAKTMGPNAQAGKVWENQVNTLAESKYGSSNVESQVLVRPLDANGNPVNYRVRLDNTITQPGQPLRLLDAKGSAKAGFTKNQRQGYPLIGNHGGVIESGPMKGMRIPKTDVETIRPGGLGDI